MLREVKHFQPGGELAPGFAGPTRQWLLVLLDSGPRARPRSEATIYAYSRPAHLILQEWGRTYDHLREVTPSDIYAVLQPMSGYPRNNTAQALRSLFRFAKRHGLVFTDPTAGVRTPPIDPAMTPMTDDEIRAIEGLAVRPAERLAVALAAEHAARTSAIRHLKLDDVDLPNRRITLAGHNQRLGDLTHRAMRDWLGRRRATWPHSPNPHVLISKRTALGTGPVSHIFVRFSLGDNGFSIDRIRLTGSCTRRLPPDPTRCAFHWCSTSTTPPPCATRPSPSTSSATSSSNRPSRNCGNAHQRPPGTT